MRTRRRKSTERENKQNDMYEKDHRPRREEERRQKFSSSKWFIALIVVLCVLVVVIIAAAMWMYMDSSRIETESRAENDYLRKMVRQVNDAPETTWKAKFNKFGVKNKSYGFKYTRNSTAVKEYLDQIKGFFESDKMKKHLQELADYKDSDVPKFFDSRIKWPHCPSISNIPNQGGCGSCFAVASIGVASDRACIQSNGTYRSILSEEDVLGCCEVCGNCFGGDPLKALTYWVNEGLVTGGRDGCRPYSFDRSCGVPCSPATFFEAETKRTCIRRCQNTYYQNKYDDDKHFASLAYSMYPRSMTISEDGKERAKVPTVIGHFNETAAEPLNLTQVRNIIMKEISMFGPTTMAFPVTEEFLHYSSGVFRPFPEEGFSDRIVYWHVVRLIGWGHDDEDRQYWLAINSFGNQWGDSGTFKINTDTMEKYGLEYETAIV